MPLHLEKALSAFNLHDASQFKIQPDHFPHRHHLGHRRPRDCETAMTSHSGREVIIISDDEDAASPHSGHRRPRPNSASSASSIGHAHLDLLKPLPQVRHCRLPQQAAKRQRAEYDEDNGLPIADLHANPSTDFAKIRLRFPDGHQNNSRASFSFDNPSPTQNNAKMPLEPYEGRNRAKNYTAVPTPAKISASKSKSKCPYYFDSKLEVNMYCGHGYERFPVVLGTVKGHKAICENWDAGQDDKRKFQMAQGRNLLTGENPAVLSINPTILWNDSRDITGALQCLREVLIVFPRIEHKFVEDKYEALRARLVTTAGPDIQEHPASAEIIAEIADLGSYPKQEAAEISEALIPLPEDQTGITIKWNKDIPKTETYCKEAIILLAAEFTHIPTHVISKMVREKNSLFNTYVYFYEIENDYYGKNGAKPYSRSKTARVLLEKKYSRGLNEHRDGHLYVHLINELQAARQQAAREEARTNKIRAKEAAEAKNLATHIAEGAVVECQCCFDAETAINRSLMCEGDVGHFFCFGCVLGLAESQVGAMKYEMRCMDSSGCTFPLPSEGVGQAVTTKLFDKLAFYEQQAEISAAGIEGLEQCPQCEFKAICDPVEVNCVFMCQNTDCGKVTCRKCHEDSHLPKTCEEAKEDKGLSARHLVEEARSQAMIRQCPKCKAKIIKELGCNKMMCSCGCMMCYVCKADISGGKDGGYQHFHQAGAKCPLYDAQGTERHDEDANAAEKEAIRKVKANEEYQDVDEKLLQVGTGAGTAKEKKKKRPGHPQVQIGLPMLAARFEARGADIDRQIAALEQRRQALYLRQIQEIEPQAQVLAQQMRADAEARAAARVPEVQMRQAQQAVQLPGQQLGWRNANFNNYPPAGLALDAEPNGFGVFMPAYGQGYQAFMPNMHMAQDFDIGIPGPPAMPNMLGMPAMPDFVFDPFPNMQMPLVPANEGGQMEGERWFQDMQEHFQRQ